MKTKEELEKDLRRDLQLDVAYVPGIIKRIRNCWHVSTDGAFSDVMFEDAADFVNAMNLIAKCYLAFPILILAFCLMDNHVHFVLYGERAETERFIREFLRRVSYCISIRYGRRNVLSSIPLSIEEISDEEYLKNAICYDINNPTVGGIRYNYFDYPWSSGSLYFRSSSAWTSPVWSADKLKTFKELPYSVRSSFDRSGKMIPKEWHLAGDIIFPGDYVSVDAVESLFHSHKAFCFLCGRRNEKEIEKIDGLFNALSLPDCEMRQHRNELAREMFGCSKIHSLSVPERIRLAKQLKRNFMCSTKQTARMVCLPYGQLEKML